MINNEYELQRHVKYIQSQLNGASDSQLNEVDIRIVTIDTAWQVSITLSGKFSHSLGIPPQLIPRALSNTSHPLAQKVSPYVSRVNAVSPIEADSEFSEGTERLQYIRNTIACLAAYIVFAPKTEITIADGFWDQVEAEISQLEARDF